MNAFEYNKTTLFIGDNMNVEMISVNEVKTYLNQENVQFVDLREPVEYIERHIKSAINIPYQELEEQLLNGDKLEKDWELRKDKLYIFYCDRGGVSLIAARRIMKKGYRVKSLTGGMNAFFKKNFE